MAKLSTLTQDEQDSVIYDARVGDLDSLKTIFSDEVEVSTLLTTQDEYTLATPLHMAAANGHSEVVSYLLSLLDETEVKLLINKQNESGNTALHWASLNGHVSCVKVLVENGADPFIKNKFDHDSIYEAEKSGKEEVETYLLEKFAPELEEEAGKQEDDESTVQYSKGTEIETANKEGSEAINSQTST
ncbi:hypothetical protein CANARDRAFT_29310 [[Candida] arabinofermentans NRRL YB-2248]|uniref:Uncharacterized protein n=1 Tax=[Candida] arabinofermentans NRRL YB-2248 TaxID=983967 RepID=A0A1E4SXF7_9ASCO|nr:hypothetical protein CANARDRAFT_29310 [[Candida] arabinofermentans NRRL YB-2248]